MEILLHWQGSFFFRGFLFFYMMLTIAFIHCNSKELSIIKLPDANTTTPTMTSSSVFLVAPPQEGQSAQLLNEEASLDCGPSLPWYDLRCWDQLRNRSLSCETDLGGVGSVETLCELSNSIITLPNNSIIVGNGTLEILSNVSLSCASSGCALIILLSGELHLGSNSSIVGGTLTIQASKVHLSINSTLNTTAFSGSPPAQTSGTPSGLEGAGGGHGGRGASCEKDEGKDQGDTWGGDTYAWTSLNHPWSYGSKGGMTTISNTTTTHDVGGGLGGGRVSLTVLGTLNLNGTIEANGGSVWKEKHGGSGGGGGSGGSIIIKAAQIKGVGKISASGGTGWGGGGGGRASIECLEYKSTMVLIHGGDSLGCPTNAGGAGTHFDVLLRSLHVSNNNKSTQTDTVLLEFPIQRPLWESLIIDSSARVGVPLLWSRIQVRDRIKLSRSSSLSFGLARFSNSEFELVANEISMDHSAVKVFGALRMTVRVLVMTRSAIEVLASKDDLIVATSTVEASSMVLLQGGSSVQSNSNLGMYGQGLLSLIGLGDCIKAQRLFLSLFYQIYVGHNASIQAPLEADSPIKEEITKLYCESTKCPVEVMTPSEDCTLRISSPFSLQICRVDHIVVSGIVRGSVVHIQRARNVTISYGGVISASALGCQGGLGKGNYTMGSAGGGGGHGGKGGPGIYDSKRSEGGVVYGNRQLPCELGSGGGTSGVSMSSAGGGVIVLGSLDHPISTVEVYGDLVADGESLYEEGLAKAKTTVAEQQGNNGGPGGGSGGSLLLFLKTMTMGNMSLLSSVGGHGGLLGGGGGGGGRVHFHWSNIATGEDFVPLATGRGLITTWGGTGSQSGLEGESGTVTGKPCPRGLYGLFCEECQIGTYKDKTGSAKHLCKPCPPEQLPHRALYTYVRGGVVEPKCPYQCTSEKYRMPNCYTMLEDLVYTLGGPWLFTLLLSCIMVILALVLSVARMKLVGDDDFTGPPPLPSAHQGGAHIDHSFPFLESLEEVLETTRVEESQTHIHRMFFMGSNSFGEPWHLPHSPPEQIIDHVYEDAFNLFVEEVNTLAAYQWWEGSVHSILTVLAYPIAWLWQDWRRRLKIQRLREYVCSEYDHSCLRSCRSRALYEGLKVAATPDLMLAYVDLFLGGDEKQPDLPPRLMQRLPMSVLFGGNGSYMAPYSLHSDTLLTSLLGQAMPATMWYRMVAGLNAQLRTVRRGWWRRSLLPVINWLNTHVNPWISIQGLRADLAWFQATSSGYFQLGLVLSAESEEVVPYSLHHYDLRSLTRSSGSARYGLIDPDGVFPRPKQSWHLSPSYSMLGASRRRIGGAILDSGTLRSLEEDHRPSSLFMPLILLLRNTRPVGHQASVGLVISLLLLVDLSLTLLTLLQYYSMSVGAILIVVLVLPLVSLLPNIAGLNALFSHGPRRAASLARVYALWNTTAIVNMLVAVVLGFFYYELVLEPPNNTLHHSSFSVYKEDDSWWVFPGLLLLVKCMQAQMIDSHIANLEIQDATLYSADPTVFWES